MGHFIEVVNPGHGDLIQLHAGVEDYERNYKVGDLLPWQPDFYWPGDWPDDVHWECYGRDGKEYWIVVKGLRIFNVLETPKRSDGKYCTFGQPHNWDPNNGVEWDDNVPTLGQKYREQYGIQEPPRELWPDLAWERKEWLQQCAEEKHEERLQRLRDSLRKQYGREPIEQEWFEASTIDAVNEYTRSKMQEDGFLRRIMPGYHAPPQLRPDLDWLGPKINERLGDWRWADRLVVQQYWQPYWSEERMVKDAIHYIGHRLLFEAGVQEFIHLNPKWNAEAFRWDFRFECYNRKGS